MVVLAKSAVKGDSHLSWTVQNVKDTLHVFPPSQPEAMKTYTM